MKAIKIELLAMVSLTLFLTTFAYASLLDEKLQKLKQAGIPTTIEELNLPEIPDSENGALVYKEASKLVSDLIQKYRKEFEYMPYNGIVAGGWEKTPEEWKKKIADLILHNPEFAKVYQLLEKASNMKCRFYTEKGVRKEFGKLDIYSQLRLVARMLAEKAKIEAEYGDINKSLSASLIGLKAAKSLSNEPSVVAQLTRMAIDSIALGELQKNINKKEAEQSESYLLLVKEMETERRQNISHFGLRSEYLEFWVPVSSNFRKIAGRSFEFTDEDKKELEERWKNSSIEDRMIESEKKRREIYKGAYLKSRCKNVDDFLKEQELFFLKTLIKVFPLLQKPYWETREELKNIEVEIEKASKEKAFLTYIIPFASLARAYLQEARSDALFGAAELGLANRIYRQKHGKFADSLNQLIPEILPSVLLDPFTGKDYIYRIKDKGFIIYSVADNLKDDGGIPKFSEQGKKGDFDIVWEDNGAGYPDPLTNLPDGNRVKSLFQSMRDKTYTQWDWPLDFPVLGWSDIPNLIKIAESERMLQNYPVSGIPSLSSESSEKQHPESMEGMIALWLIEGIRKGSRFPSLESGGFPSLNPICFEYGKANTTQEIHRKVYGAYSKWWRMVKDLPKEKAVKVDPLKGTGLYW